MNSYWIGNRAGVGLELGVDGEGAIYWDGVTSKVLSSEDNGYRTTFFELKITGNRYYDHLRVAVWDNYTSADHISSVIGTRNGTTTLVMSNLTYSISDFNRGAEAPLLDQANVITGNRYADRIDGQDRADTIYGHNGNDSLWGGDANDYLYGGGGEDKLFGGAKSDRITGGADDDKITGGSGRDRFIFDEDDGRDQVMDFVDGADKIVFGGSIDRFGQVKITDLGADALVTAGKTTILLEDTDHRALTAADFVFL